MLDLQDRLDELKQLGLYRRMRMVSGPQGPRVLLDGTPGAPAVLGQLPRAGRPPARARGGGRRGAALGRGDGRVAAGVGQHDAAPAARGAAGRVRGHRRARCCSARATSPTSASCRRWRGRASSSSPTSSTTRRWSTAAGSRARRSWPTAHGDADHLAWALRNADGRGALIVTDAVFSDRRRRRAARGDRRARPPPRRARDGRRGARRRGARAGRPRHGRGGGPRGRGRRVVGSLGTALGSYGAYVGLRRATARYLVNSARPLMFSTGLPPAAVAAALAALELLAEQPRRVERLADNAERAARRAGARGLRRLGLGDAHRAADGRRRRAGGADRGGGARAGRLRAGGAPAGGAGGHVAAAARGHGLAHAATSCATPRGSSPAPRCATGSVPSVTVPVAAAQSRAPSPSRVFDGDADLARAA